MSPLCERHCVLLDYFEMIHFFNISKGKHTKIYDISLPEMIYTEFDTDIYIIRAVA